MKTKSCILMFSTLLAAFALLAAPASAQPAEGKDKDKKSESGPKRPGGGERLEQMRERLGLTDAQIEQLRPIFAAEREELMAKRKELGKDATREERREAMREVHEKYQDRIQAVLTDEQKEKIGKQRERVGKKGGPGADGAGSD